MKKGGISWSRSKKIKKHKLLAFDIFRLIRPFSRVQIDTEDQDYGFGLVPQKLKNKLLALDIFRLIRPFSRVQIDTEGQD